MWSRLYGSSRGLAIAETARQYRGPLLVITAEAHAREELEDELRFYLGKDETLLIPFPDWECLPYDAFSPHQEIISQRLRALSRLPRMERGIVLATVATLLHRIAPLEYIGGHSLLLDTGDRLEIEKFRGELQRTGYQSVSQVMEPGEYAVRGELIDLFPMGSHAPYRIDLLDDRIESIREFDPQTQRSEKRMEGARLLPAHEFPMTQEGIQQFRQAFRARFEGDPQKNGLYRDVSKGICPAGIEYYLPLFFERTATVFDYLPENTLCLTDADTMQAIRTFTREAGERYDLRRHDRERPVLAPAELFLDETEFMDRIQGYAQIHVLRFKEDEPAADISAGARPADENMAVYAISPPARLAAGDKAALPYSAFVQYLHDRRGRTLIVAESRGRKETLLALMRDHSLAPEETDGWREWISGKSELGIVAADLEKGLLLHEPEIAVITEQQLHGEHASQRRRRQRPGRDPWEIIKSLAELRSGDPVVHEEHGVGRYLGLQILDVGDGLTEFLALEYAGGDKLYIPVVALHLISRYTGVHPESAPLHKLGGDVWEKSRRRALKRAYDTAAEILEVMALRAARQGHAFAHRDGNYLAVTEAFPFEETPDQARAIEEVLGDMESGRPMDRLVCGDVGFGKTEVAIRAAFLAGNDHRQVAILTPTTLLAQQHYQNFRDRFAGMPVAIELMSRFRTKKELERVLAGLADGSVDIVIGTHRLLQGDVHFKRLGLVIIDEEHRFGVRQKEKLKKLRSEVDILTLTATPIPRTLNMALANLRDISIIATAPEERLAVKTFVLEWNKAVIREACLREIRRGGQVFFLHNEVRTIEQAARHLRELVPEAEIRIAHGKMPERELEHIMLDFYHQRFNVLVCSTIIESGIDVPSANTIIINRADKFGLAQLHQLRGRVGRSRRRAYAYLIIPPRNVITEDARKRLEALESLEDLGAGFALASHDMEIRGAGELLGESQSGVIDEVGFNMYSELLDRAIRSLRTGAAPDMNTALHSGAVINLHAPALLPEDYLPDVHLRLVLYKRIASAKNLEALNELREEIIDRFGPLPEAGRLLFKVTELKISASPMGISKIDAGPRGMRLEFDEKPDIDTDAILRLLQSAPQSYKLDGTGRLRVLGEFTDVRSRIETIEKLLDELAWTRD